MFDTVSDSFVNFGNKLTELGALAIIAYNLYQIALIGVLIYTIGWYTLIPLVVWNIFTYSVIVNQQKRNLLC